MPLYNREQAWELALLALAVDREGRGQPFRGKVGIAWTVRNRVHHSGHYWWGDDWEEVVLKKYQYSAFNPGDPNAYRFPKDPKSDPDWAQTLQIAEDVYNGTIADPTGGATHYHRWDMNPKPPWVEGPPPAVFTVQLGDHMFYKGVK